MKKEIWLADKQLAEKFGLLFYDEENAVRVEVGSNADLKKFSEKESAGAERIFITCPNWKIIPLENIIAAKKKAKLVAEVGGLEEARLAFTTLEKGVDGVLIRKIDEANLREIMKLLSDEESVSISNGKVTEIKRVGTGARSCIDTSDMMTKDDGLLVGSTAEGFMLVQAEVNENPHVNTRPFRVNAGAVSLYTHIPEGKTRYLTELKAGEEVLIVDKQGRTRRATVVRNKIEWRPMLLIEAEAEGKTAKAILQEAETIQVMTPDGAKPVTSLKKGDEILVHVEEQKARHFGMKADERIVEK